MKTIVLSDIHGYFPTITEKFDLMLICGDIFPDMPTVDALYEMLIIKGAKDISNDDWRKNWLFNDFVQWINNLPFKDKDSKVVMIAGNHDFYLEKITRKSKDALRHVTDGRLVYLDNEEYNFQGKRIFGCPYCKPYGNWAFMKEDMDKYYSFIPEKLDILICHDSPDINNLGMIQEGKWAGTNAGNPVLAEYIKKVKPKYCFSGHLHSGNHNMFTEDGTTFANVSIMDDFTKPTHQPLILDIE